MTYTKAQLESLRASIESADHILIMQAEHVDADSLGSSLGLESALTAQGKKTTMFCYDLVPNYLQHLPGWDRVTQELPGDYDLAILVDSSTLNQLEKTWSAHKNTILKRPLICIDHHSSKTAQLKGDNITLLIDETAGASGQQVTELAQELGWEIDPEAAYSLASAIKADTVNLATAKTSARTFLAMAYLVNSGADLELLRYNIEQTNSIRPEDLPLKAEILKRARFFKGNRIAITYFTQEEYEAMKEDQLLIERTKQEMRMLKGVDISVTITERKGYANASMRANIDAARLVAEHFGGGGHDRAASCRFMDAGHEQVIEQIVPVIEKFIDEAA